MSFLLTSQNGCCVNGLLALKFGCKKVAFPGIFHLLWSVSPWQTDFKGCLEKQMGDITSFAHGQLSTLFSATCKWHNINLLDQRHLFLLFSRVFLPAMKGWISLDRVCGVRTWTHEILRWTYDLPPHTCVSAVQSNLPNSMGPFILFLCRRTCLKWPSGWPAHLDNCLYSRWSVLCYQLQSISGFFQCIHIGFKAGVWSGELLSPRSGSESNYTYTVNSCL